MIINVPRRRKKFHKMKNCVQHENVMGEMNKTTGNGSLESVKNVPRFFEASSCSVLPSSQVRGLSSCECAFKHILNSN